MAVQLKDNDKTGEMEKKREKDFVWNKPSMITLDKEALEKLHPKVLTVESLLYASGCHAGRIIAY